MLGKMDERRTYFVATFACCWLILVFTTPGIPIVWDEGEYLTRAKFIIEWVRLLPHAFSREAVQRYWLFINYAEGHPAGFALPIALTQWLGSPFLDPLTASRLGPITLFSAACGFVAVSLKQTHGTAAAIVAPAALVTFPRIFSEAHFATQDGQLTAWWLILWAIQSSSIVDRPSSIVDTPDDRRSPIDDRRSRVTMALGLVLGLVTATKFTGWLAWAPTVLTQVAQRNVTALRRLLVILPLAILIFYIVNVPLWLDPIDGLREHFHRSLDRANTLNITTEFLGETYSVSQPLPWYNTFVWLVFATPLPTLVLGLAGLAHCLLHRTVFSVALILHWLTLMVVRALPGAPPHDGIRLFLPAFGFWCVLAGIGAQAALNAVKTRPAVGWSIAVRLAVIIALVANVVTLARYYPQTLSHYSVIAGGVRGAAEKGMEPAYWWDALDNDVLRWLNRNTDPHDSIAFSPAANIGFLREWRGLRPKEADPQKDQFKWYVLQNRPGLFSRVDRALMRDGKPAFVKFAGRRRAGDPVPHDLDVPLIYIFSYEQYQQARRATREKGVGRYLGRARSSGSSRSLNSDQRACSTES